MLPAMVRRWRQAHCASLLSARRGGEISAVLVSVTKFIRFFVQIAILGLGAVLVLEGQLTAGGMIAASILLGRALAPVEHAITAWRNFTGARIAYDRLKSHLESFPAEPSRIMLPEPRGIISVDRLTCFAPQSGTPILRQVSFEAEPGELIAVVGPSGAGKSTLCRLIVGLGQATSGTIRIDGSEIKHWSSLQLGRHVGYLPQDVELFSGTVRDNIARMTECSDADVIKAAMLAHAHDLVRKLPAGYDTQIGEGGARLSGGQRQRIGLARAVFGEPKLLVLDEPNANLDTAGEAALAAALAELKAGGAVTLVVGHRPSTLAQADKILLLRDGRVEIFGPRNEVLARMRKATSAAGEIAVTAEPDDTVPAARPPAAGDDMHTSRSRRGAATATATTCGTTRTFS
jgi:PrtD family type I secretion system ABC transporter